jgi:hypothetical protein
MDFKDRLHVLRLMVVRSGVGLPELDSETFRPALRFINTLEPYLVPIWIDASGAKQPIPTKTTTAGYIFKDKASVG